jgi:hypothetical protein
LKINTLFFLFFLVGNPLAVINPRKTKKDYAFTDLKTKNNLFLEILSVFFFGLTTASGLPTEKNACFCLLFLVFSQIPKSRKLVGNQ